MQELPLCKDSGYISIQQVFQEPKERIFAIFGCLILHLSWAISPQPQT